MPVTFPLLDSYTKKYYLKFKKYYIRFCKASSIFEAFLKIIITIKTQQLGG